MNPPIYRDAFEVADDEREARTHDPAPTDRNPLLTLLMLAHQHEAGFHLKLDTTGELIMKFKLRGKKPEIVSQPFAQPFGDTNAVARALLKRLNWYRAVARTPASDSRLFFASLTPDQLTRALAIQALWKAFKHDVLFPTPLEHVEPALAPPRSSLQPNTELYQCGEPDGDLPCQKGHRG